MPTYDYLCPNGHRFEVIHSVIADGPTSCPICGASPVRKAFSAPTIHFKGSGWAKKDRSTASRSAARAASGAESGSGAERSSGAGSDAGATTGSGTDKAAGSSTDGSATSEAKPAPDKTASQGTGKGTGPTGNAGPPAAD